MSTPMTPDKEDVDITLRHKSQSDATNPGHGAPREVSGSAEDGFHKENSPSQDGALITPNSDDDDAIEITVMGNNKHIEELKEEIERTHRENQEFKQQVSVQIKNAFDQHNANPQDDVVVPNGEPGKWAGLRTCTKTFLTFAILLALIAILINLMGAKDAPQQLIAPAPAPAAAEEVWPKLTQFSDNDIIDFDVGGTTGQTKIRYGLLLQVPESKMYAKFIKKQMKQKNGTVFVDRPLQAFKNVLNFLRNGLVMPTLQDGYETKMFKLELKFWGLPSRKPTPFEYDLLQIFEAVPTGDMVSKGALAQWKKLLPFNLLEVVDDNSAVIDESDAVAALVKPDIYEWNGQAASGAAQGFGRILGDFGIYEGQCASGVVDGYGRLIWDNGNSFIGQFSKGEITGAGSYYYAFTDKTFVGTWTKGVLTASADPEDGLKGFVIDMEMPFPVQDPAAQTVSKISDLLKNKPELGYLGEGASAKDAAAFKKVQDKWQNAKKMNVKELESLGLVKIDKKLPVTTIKSDKFIYDGQVTTAAAASRRNLKSSNKPVSLNDAAAKSSQQVSQGFGRQYGLFGVYEGEFNQGKIHGYGRMIMKNLDTYQGEFADGLYNGVGKLVLDTGKILQGTWKAGVLQATGENDKAAGYVAPKPDVPSVLRLKSPLELYLDSIYATVPKGTSKTVLTKWVALGPYDISGLVASRSVSLKAYENLGDTKGEGKDLGGAYEGQTFANATIWYNLTAQARYENTNKVVQAFGYGRIVKPTYMYEGLLLADKNGQLPGRIITATSRSGSASPSRHEIANEVSTYVVQTGLIHQLSGLYASQTTAELSSFLSAARGPFNFQEYWVKQLLTLDATVDVTIIDKNNFGQMNSKGQKHGFGRQLTKTFMYDGQFSQDQPSGYGRLITLNKDSSATVTEGYFFEGQYKAANQTVYEIEQHFQTPLFAANQFVESPTKEQVVVQKDKAFFNQNWSKYGAFSFNTQSTKGEQIYADNAIGTYQLTGLGVQKINATMEIPGKEPKQMNQVIRSGLLTKAVENTEVFVSPECSDNFDQNAPYSYNKGCGHCDYQDLCETQAYCRKCCTNAGDYDKHNRCRLQTSQETQEEFQRSIKTLNITRDIVNATNGQPSAFSTDKSVKAPAFIAESTGYNNRVFYPKLPDLGLKEWDAMTLSERDGASLATLSKTFHKVLGFYPPGPTNNIYVYENEMIIFSLKSDNSDNRMGGYMYLTGGMAKMFWIWQQKPQEKYFQATFGTQLINNDWTPKDFTDYSKDFSTLKSAADQLPYNDITNNNITTISGEDFTFTGQVQYNESTSMLVAQGLGRLQSKYCIYEGYFVQGLPDHFGWIINNEGTSAAFKTTDIKSIQHAKLDTLRKECMLQLGKTESEKPGIFKVQQQVDVALNETQLMLQAYQFTDSSMGETLKKLGQAKLGYNLWELPGVWDIEFNSKLERQQIITSDFSYYGQVKSATVGEGFGYLVNEQGAWKGYQSSSGSTQSGKLWFINGDVYEGFFNNWEFQGQGKLSIALTGLSYEGVWDKNNLSVGKFSYQNGFSYKNNKFTPIFERKASKTELYLNEKVFQAPLQLIISSDKFGSIADAVQNDPYDLTKVVSQAGSKALSDDQKLIQSREQDYYGQDPKEVTIAFGRIFLNDSLYEGMVKGKTAHGYGRLTYLDGIVKNVTGNWNNGEFAGFKTKNKYLTRKIEITALSVLQWKIIDLFNSEPKSIISKDDFDKLPRYAFLDDKDIIMNEKFFIEGSNYVYCKLESFEGLCEKVKSKSVPALGRTTTKSYFFDGQMLNNQFNGFGQVYTLSNETYFSGTFKDGMKMGKGSSYSKGKSVESFWYNSIYMGEYTQMIENEYRIYTILQGTPQNDDNKVKNLKELQTLWSKYATDYFVNKEINQTSGFIKPQFQQSISGSQEFSMDKVNVTQDGVMINHGSELIQEPILIAFASSELAALFIIDNIETGVIIKFNDDKYTVEIGQRNGLFQLNNGTKIEINSDLTISKTLNGMFNQIEDTSGNSYMSYNEYNLEQLFLNQQPKEYVTQINKNKTSTLYQQFNNLKVQMQFQELNEYKIEPSKPTLVWYGGCKNEESIQIRNASSSKWFVYTYGGEIEKKSFDDEDKALGYYNAYIGYNFEVVLYFNGKVIKKYGESNYYVKQVIDEANKDHANIKQNSTTCDLECHKTPWCSNFLLLNDKCKLFAKGCLQNFDNTDGKFYRKSIDPEQKKEVVKYRFKLNNAQNQAKFVNTTNYQGLTSDNKTTLLYGRQFFGEKPNQFMVQGQFKDGEPNGYVTKVVPGEYVFMGMMNGDLQNGAGTHYWQNGSISESYAENGKTYNSIFEYYLFENFNQLPKAQFNYDKGFSETYDKQTPFKTFFKEFIESAGLYTKFLNLDKFSPDKQFEKKSEKDRVEYTIKFNSSYYQKECKNSKKQPVLKRTVTKNSVEILAQVCDLTSVFRYYDQKGFSQEISYVTGNGTYQSGKVGNATQYYFNGTSEVFYYADGVAYQNAYAYKLQSVFMSYPDSFKKVMEVAGIYQVQTNGLKQSDLQNSTFKSNGFTYNYSGQSKSSLSSSNIGQIINSNKTIIQEGVFIGYEQNGEGRLIELDSYFVGSFSKGLKNGMGTLTFLGNSSSITGTWLNDKYTGECFGQLAELSKKPQTIKFSYTESKKPQTSKVAPSTYFENKDSKKCPITECQVMDQTCKVPQTNITAGQKSPFSLSAFTNVTAGFQQQICLICKNKHDSASVKLDISQSDCNATKNCPITTCKGQLTKLDYKKEISFNYTQSNVPQVVKNMLAPNFFVNKASAKCPITNCTLMDNDCDEPFMGGFISLDSNNTIQVITDFVQGWKQQVCIVCANKDSKVKNQIVINQQPCNLTNNCPANNGTGLQQGTGECIGFLDHIDNPPKINFPFTIVDKPQYAKINATQFFVNKNATKCPITKCTMMDNDCDEPFVDEIGIENFSPFRINAKTDYDNGWKKPVCVVCENIDEKVGIEMVIDQIPCNVSGTCPAKETVKQEGTGACAQYLDHIEDPPKIEFNFVPQMEPQFAKINATQFFSNKDAKKCPIIGCQLMGKDCQNPYLDGITVDSAAPFRIGAISNYVVGWQDPVCLICENVDQKVAIEIQIDQLPCNVTNNCPAHGGNGLEAGSGSCKGFLEHVERPKPIVFSYGEQQAFEYTYSDITAPEFFVNKNATKCPITKCTMKDNDCDEPYADGIEIENYLDFKIKAKTDFPGGRNSAVCIVCENIDEIVGIEMIIDQQPCDVTGNCPKGNITDKGECEGFLDHVEDPKKVEFKFVAKVEPQTSNIDATSFFVNKNATKCPIKKCSMMGPDCQQPYLDGITVDDKAPWTINAVSNYVTGWKDPICIVCENEHEKVGVEMTIDQLPCSATKNCPKDDTHEVEEQSCMGQLSIVNQPKKVEFSYVSKSEPQSSSIVATEFFDNKNAAKCPITKCQMMGPDCQSPYTDGISVVDKAPWTINAVSNFVVGWNDPVCVVCENKDEKVGFQMQIDQLPCTATKNCPKDDDHSEPTTCEGQLVKVEVPQKIQFNYNAKSDPQYTTILATDYFVNKNAAKCPITKCEMNGADCQGRYLDGINVDTSSPWKINAVSNYGIGWTDRVCIVCENKDSKVGFQMQIEQLPCSATKNCPKDEAHEEEEQSCRGKLTRADTNQKIDFNYVNEATPQYSTIIASSFFSNSDSTKCPITRCIMMGPDCQTPYLDGISIDKSAPWRINAVSNYVTGWKDPVCIVCSNKEERVPFALTIDQLPCSATKNCPKDEAHEEEEQSCRGKLSRADTNQKIDFNFVTEATPQYSNILASSFFSNSDSTKCPITRCEMMGPDCQTPYKDGISIDKSAPWKISAVSDYPTGWKDPVCIVCSNKDDRVPFELTIDQLPCSATKNCPKDDGDHGTADADKASSSSKPATDSTGSK